MAWVNPLALPTIVIGALARARLECIVALSCTSIELHRLMTLLSPSAPCLHPKRTMLNFCERSVQSDDIALRTGLKYLFKKRFDLFNEQPELTGKKVARARKKNVGTDNFGPHQIRIMFLKYLPDLRLEEAENI